MTNTRTILGAFAWSTLAATLMLIALAPVNVEQPAARELSARAVPAPHHAAL
jgi:hypothetical protein